MERNAALRRYIDTKAEVKQLDTELKEKKAKLAEEMRNAFEILRKDGTTKSTTVDLGEGYGEYRFTPGTTKRNDVYNKDDLLAWIKSEGLEEEYLWSSKFRDAALNDLIREKVDHERDEDALPPGLHYVETKKVTVTKIAPKKA